MRIYAKISSPFAIMARDAIQTYLDANQTTVNALAMRCEVSQSTLSRFMNGKTKTVTTSVKKVLKTTGIKVLDPGDDKTQPVELPLTMAAISEIWDGDPNTDAMLAALVRGMIPALRLGRRPR